jgi:ubiquinone/menaquinone biosynthesis C-methylase UbiE
MSEKKNYIDIVYNEKDRPFTNYPDRLTKYIYNRFDLNKFKNILDVGCGRGEFLNGFSKCNLEVYGIDQNDASKQNYSRINFKSCDLLKEKIPYDDNYFDVVFSKSLVEHFYYPEKIFKEMHRVLKKDGILITMTPDWEINYKTFYEDYTHRTPFSKTSLKDIHLINGFQDVKIYSFKQLPILWKNKSFANSVLSIFSEITRVFIPNYFKKYKWVRFSKEIILLSVAKK